MTRSDKTQSKTNIYILASGGTGGHLFPALSLSQEFIGSMDVCHLVTDNRGAHFFKEYDVSPSLVCNIHRSHWLFGRLAYPFSLVYQIIRCYVWLLKVRPTAVIGFGGYPSFPCVFAAQCLGVTTYLHEGNSFLGKANRLLLKRAKKIGLSFPPTENQITDERFFVTGMPVRSEIRALMNEHYMAPIADSIFNILVIGGSQGAKIFGSVIPKAISLLPFDLQKRIVITQQCRESQLKDVKNAYSTVPCQKIVKPFLSPMNTYYKDAHLVIARAGASTIAEISIAGKPTLLVPFPGSLEGDQAKNAKQLVDANAAWLIKESSFTPEKVAEFITNVMNNPHLLVEKYEHVRRFARPDAAKNLQDMIQL